MSESRKLEAGSRFDDLLEIISDGSEVLITRKGENVARFVPVMPGANEAETLAAIGRIRARARMLSHPRPGPEELRAFRNEGRP